MSQTTSDRLNYHGTHRGNVLCRSSRLVRHRLESIRSHLDFRGKSVLDLGCSGGYFSLNIASEANHVLGVDGDPEVIRQNIALAREKGVGNVKFVEASLTRQFISVLPQYDIVLFLSVFHHMLGASDAYDWNSEELRSEAFDTLGEIRKKARVLVFEMGYPDEGYDWSTKLPPMVPDPVTWIVANIFGDDFSVQVISPPVMKGRLGAIRRWLLHNHESRGIVWRILRRILHVDVRDKRHLFIGTKTG